MMISEGDVDDSADKSYSESAVLEVTNSNATDSILRNQDADYFSNYSTSVEGSVVASPSIDSFSTLAEQDVSELQLDTRDLQVKVDNPQKHVETLETYITFRITTKSTRPEFEDGEYVVRRRYNDFIWLRKKLIETYPTHIIPPMPGKHPLLAQLDRYSKEFIIARMKLLHIFLNRVVNHPILSCDKNLHAFLTYKPVEFSLHRTNRGTVLTKVTDSLQTMTHAHTIKQRHLEFEQIRDYCTSLSEKLNTIDKIGLRIHKERQDYVSELQQLHPLFATWANSELELSPVLLSIAKAVESNVAAHQKLLACPYNEEKEYTVYIDAVKDALSRRDCMQIDYELTVDELTKKRQEKEQLEIAAASATSGQSWGGSLWKSESRDEKLERLGQTIPRLAKTVELLQDRLECANENLRSDLQQWDVEKQSDLKSMLLSMADQQIQHYQQCMDAWEQVLSSMKVDAINTEISGGAPVKNHVQ